MEWVWPSNRDLRSFNVACKWKRKWGWAPDEGWFILTNLSDLESAILAYKNALELRRCARDFKSGGYNLEGTRITGNRLVVLILLIAIAYTTATMQGKKSSKWGYKIHRSGERDRSSTAAAQQFYGLYGQTWVNFIDECAHIVAELMKQSQ